MNAPASSRPAGAVVLQLRKTAPLSPEAEMRLLADRVSEILGRIDELARQVNQRTRAHRASV